MATYTIDRHYYLGIPARHVYAVRESGDLLGYFDTEGQARMFVNEHKASRACVCGGQDTRCACRTMSRNHG